MMRSFFREGLSIFQACVIALSMIINGSYALYSNPCLKRVSHRVRERDPGDF